MVIKISKTIYVKGMLKDVPKTISHGGQSWEQTMGTHTLAEIKRDILRYKTMYPHEKHIIVKSVLDNTPYHISWGSQKFYWIYSRRK